MSKIVKVADVIPYFEKYSEDRKNKFEFKDIRGGVEIILKEGTLLYADEIRRLLDHFDLSVVKSTVNNETWVLIN